MNFHITGNCYLLEFLKLGRKLVVALYWESNTSADLRVRNLFFEAKSVTQSRDVNAAGIQDPKLTKLKLAVY